MLCWLDYLSCSIKLCEKVCVRTTKSKSMEIVLQAPEKPKSIDKYYLLHDSSLENLREQNEVS